MHSNKPATPVVLIVDQDRATGAMLETVFHELNLSPVTVTEGADAARRLREIAPAFAVVSLSLPDIPATHLVERFAGARIPVIALADGANLRGAVEAMRAGATDVVDKRRSAEELLRAVQRLLPLTTNRIEKGRAGSEALFGRYEALFHRSGKMRALEPIVARLAAVSVPVLIRGEEGVGKEGVATAIHSLSLRSAAPLVKVTCSSLPADVLEAQLPGMVQAAEGGSLFLEEVGDLPASVQTQLRHLLDGRGGNVRILSSTSVDMYTLIGSGRFQGDLYEELAAATIDVPPLRERPEEIVPLATRFIERFAREFERPVPELAVSMVDALVSYRWPGNIAELESLIKRWVGLGMPNEVMAELDARAAATARSHRSANGTALGLRDIAREAAREAERIAIQAALQRAKGNRAAVARQLKVSYKTLLQKLSATGLATTGRVRRRL
jgi:DNA-binding NtrC family response regulator